MAGLAEVGDPCLSRLLVWCRAWTGQGSDVLQSCLNFSRFLSLCLWSFCWLTLLWRHEAMEFKWPTGSRQFLVQVAVSPAADGELRGLVYVYAHETQSHLQKMGCNPSYPLLLSQFFCFLKYLLRQYSSLYLSVTSWAVSYVGLLQSDSKIPELWLSPNVLFQDAA